MTTHLPGGTVTLLFTDIEGSTRLLHEIGSDPYAAALREHRRIVREGFHRHGGVEVDTEGDAFFVAFSDATAALAAADDVQRGLASGPIRVRMGLHTGTPTVTPEGYVGVDVHKGARIAAAAHGGQVILSRETRLLLDERFELVDLGEHRLKDFAAPVWFYQLGGDRFPPLRTLSNTNLPRPSSWFVGRKAEVSEIASLLRGNARFVTLTGPGGTGKTRLAIEAAAELVPSFRNGVFWIGLAAERDPALVPDVIGRTIGARDALADHIGEREMLLVLDNLEQVVAAAPELAALVETCPHLRLLVTSRERLRVRGEVEFGVDPLADEEAVRLFCERANVDPDGTILELCRHLDGLPLAVELAAARTNVLSPARILERLSGRLDLLKGGRDLEARQATLRATIAWSYELLMPDEQRLFARLSVFRGGWTVEAAEAVCSADIDILASLVDKSLVRHADDRFTLLETIREFAVECLETSGEAGEVRDRHARFFLALAEEAAPHLRSRPGEWLGRLEVDHDNLREALDRLEVAPDRQEALRLAAALYRFWYFRGHLVEGRRRLEPLLRADDRPTAARGGALHGAAVMAVNSGDPVTGRLHAEEALAIHRALGDRWGCAYSEYLLGMAATEESDWGRARPFFERSLSGFRELGDDHYVLLATDALAWVAGELGDGPRRRSLHEEALRLARGLGDLAVVALQLDQLAVNFALPEGRVDEARAMLAESMRINRDLGHRGSIAEGLSRVAQVFVAEGSIHSAARLLGAAEALRDEIGGGPTWAAEMNDATRRQIRSTLEDAAFRADHEAGAKLSMDEAIELALASASSRPPVGRLGSPRGAGCT